MCSHSFHKRVTTHATELTTFCVEITIMFLQCGLSKSLKFIIISVLAYLDYFLRNSGTVEASEVTHLGKAANPAFLLRRSRETRRTRVCVLYI